MSAKQKKAAFLVIFFGCLIAFLTFGIRTSFGVFTQPISESLGWGREIFGMSIAIQNIIWGAAMPAAGLLADKYGSGKVLATGGAIFAGGVVLMAYSTDPLSMHMTAGVMVGLGVAGASFTVVLAAIGRVAPEKWRSLALGVGTAAGSAGQLAMVPLGQALIAAYQWQTALIILGIVACIVIPAAAAVRGRSGALNPATDLPVGAALKEAMTYGPFLLLIAGFFVCGFHVMFIGTHLAAYLQDMNQPFWVGGAALATVGGFNIIGSLAAGWVGGKFSKKYSLSIIYLLRAVTIALFITLPLSPMSTLVFAAAMGLLWLSTVPLTSGLVAQFFGLRYIASLFGIVFFSHQVGSFFGAWLGGLLYDSTGSYDVVWWMAVALGVFAALIHLPIREASVPRIAKAAG